MKKQILAGAMALCMVGSMLPIGAMAAETAGPSAQQISISSDKGTHISSPDGADALRMDIPTDAVLELGTIKMVTTEAVTLADQSADYAGSSNTIYGTGEGLAISISVKGMTAAVPVEMTSDDGINWTGSGSVPSYPGVTDVTVGALANELGGEQITVAPGVLTADGQASAAAKVTVNQDAANAYLYLYPADLDEYKITFVVSGNAYTFVQPAGTELFAPKGLEVSGSTLKWYSDPAFEEETQVNGIASQNVTFYGKYESSGEKTSFAAQLEDPTDMVLTIYDKADFDTFAVRANEVGADRLVELDKEMAGGILDLEGATYAAISNFEGDFNGNNITIANASFTAVSGNAGMFATLGKGQVVANLKLDNITVNQSGATYSGTLVGSAGGVESGGSGQVTIQNVQVSNSTVRGRSAGGITGYMIWTDVKYCSVTGGDNMEITGTVNAGGVAGISYNNITDCYVIATPDTTLPILNDVGGIVGKNLDTIANINHCWCTYDVIASKMDTPSIVKNCIAGVDRGTDKSDFENEGFDDTYWVLADGTGSHFTDAVAYDFM